MITVKNSVISLKTLVAFLLVVASLVVVTGCKKEKPRPQKPPVMVAFRNSLMDNSTKVMQVTNKSKSKRLLMKVGVKNSQTGESASYSFEVSPRSTYEIGKLEMGWMFKSGETYSLEADGYPSHVSGTVP